MRKKNYYDVNNALSIGEDAEGGYLVPDEFERKLVEGLEEESFFRTLSVSRWELRARRSLKMP